MKRRGINEIVTTVLITLIVLVLVAVVWVYTKNFVLDSGEIDTQSFTSSFSISPDSISVDSLAQVVTFVVKRNAGEGEVIGFNLVLDDIAGNSRSFKNYTTIKEFEAIRFYINYSGLGLGNLAKISIAPIFLGNFGREIAGGIAVHYSGPLNNSFNSSGGGGPNNLPPSVNAGADINVSASAFPFSLLVTGSASDDGLPNGTLSYNWTPAIAPIQVILKNDTTLTVNVTFNASGVYTLRLNVSDSNLTTTDIVVINVTLNSSGGGGGNSSIIFLTECGNHSVSNTYYKLMNDVSTIGICFVFNETDNVVFDGNGFTVDGDDVSFTGQDDYGILTYEAYNVTIKNVTVSDFSWGILLFRTNNSLVANSTAYSSIEGGITAYNFSNNNRIVGNVVYGNTHGIVAFIFSSNNDIVNNTAYANTGGIDFLQSSVNNKVDNNSVYGNYLNGVSSSSTSGTGNTFRGNIINSNPEGIRIINSQNNFFSNNRLSGNANSIIFHYNNIANNNNRFLNNWINGSTNNAIYFNTPNAQNNNFTNTTIVNTSPSFYDINFVSAASFTHNFLTNTYANRYNLPGAGTFIHFHNTLYGDLRYGAAISGTGANLSADVRLRFNNAYINPATAGLNRTANITLYLPPSNSTSLAIYNGQSVCSGCFNFTPLNAASVKFRVPSSGNFSIR